jgi:hypothetical protein
VFVGLGVEEGFKVEIGSAVEVGSFVGVGSAVAAHDDNISDKDIAITRGKVFDLANMMSLGICGMLPLDHIFLHIT